MMHSRRMGVTVQELSRELEVTEKTIRRDLDTFKSVGLPIEEQNGVRGQKHWSVKLNGGQPEISFPMDEGLALYMGRRFLEPLAGTMFWEAAQNAFQKIRSYMPKRALDYLEKMAGHLHHTSVG